jgi:hypothetical protein
MIFYMSCKSLEHNLLEFTIDLVSAAVGKNNFVFRVITWRKIV